MFDIITECLSETLKILVEYYYISENIDLISRSLERAEIIFNAEYTESYIYDEDLEYELNKQSYKNDMGFL